MSTPVGSTQKFVTTVSSWLSSLPHDLRVLFEAKDEPNLDRVAREAAAGAIIKTLTPDNGAGVDNELSRFADDAILLRTVLKFVVDKGGEGAGDFRERFSEYYESLDQDLAVCQQAMGETFDWLNGLVPVLAKGTVYKGKKLADYLDDDEAAEILYEDGLAFATDYPLDEEKLAMRFKKAETVLEPLRKRAELDKKKLA